MRFVWAFIWCFALVHMISYVISAMTGGTYDFVQASIMSVIFTVLAVIVDAFVPNEPVPHKHH